MGEKIHVLSAIFGSEYDGFVRGTNVVIRKSGEVGVAVGRALSAIDNMFTRLATGALATATVVGGTTAKLGSDFLILEENAKTSFTTLLGSAEAAQKMWKDLKQIARTSPFQLDGIADAARKLLGMGYAGEQVPRVLRAIGDAIAAMGGGKEMIDRVSIALGQIKAKGVVAAEEMLQLAENGIPAWQMLADAIGVDIPRAMKLVEDRAVSSDIAIEAILSGIEKRFGGMGLKMANNWTGLWAAFVDTAKEQSGEVMRPLFNSAKSWLQRITQYLESAGFRTFVAKIASQLQSLANEIDRLFADLGRGNSIQNVQSMILALLEVIRDAVSWIRDNRGAIEDWGSALGSWIKPIAQLIAAHPELVMFFALFKAAQLFGITTAMYEVSRAIGVTGKSLYALIPPIEKVSATQKYLNSTNATYVAGVKQVIQATSQHTSTTAALTQETIKANRARQAMTSAEKFFAGTASLSATGTSNIVRATAGLTIESIKAENARKAMSSAEKFFASTANTSASTIRQAVLPATEAWNQAVQQSSIVTVTAARAKEALNASAGRTQTNLLGLANSAKGAVSNSMTSLKNAVGGLSNTLNGVSSAFLSVFNISNALTFGTTIAATIVLTREQQKLNDELEKYEILRRRNEQREENRKSEETDNIMAISDPAKRREALLKAVEDAQKEHAGRRSQTDEAKKALDDLRKRTSQELGEGFLGMSPFGGLANATNPDATSQVGAALRPIYEMGGGEVSILQGELEEAKALEERANQRLESLKSLLRSMPMNAQVPNIIPPTDNKPQVPFDPDKKAKEKAAAKDSKERESDIEQAKRAFRRDMAQIFQEGVPQQTIETFQQKFDALVEAYRKGTVSTEEFEKSLESLASTTDRTAKAGGDIRDFEEDLSKALDQGFRKDWADRFRGIMNNLATRFQNGEITQDEYQREKSRLGEGVQVGVRMADQRRDFAVRAQEYQTDGQLTGAESAGFIKQIDELQNKFNAGTLTAFAYDTELKKLTLAMQNQAQANAKATQLEKQRDEAIRNANDDVAKTLEKLAFQGLLPTEQKSQALKKELEWLQNKLNNGKLSVAGFNDEVDRLTLRMERAAEEARRNAILRGDWANAGNEFNVQRAIEDRLIDMRRQQFASGIDLMVQRMTGFSGVVGSISNTIQRVGDSIRTGLNSTVTYVNEQLNSPVLWDRIQMLQQQIGILTNSMKMAPTYTIQKRLSDEIEELNRQLNMSIQQTLPRFAGPSGNATFEDPGLVSITNNLNLPNVLTFTQAQITDLANKVTREQQRQGERR